MTKSTHARQDTESHQEEPRHSAPPPPIDDDPFDLNRRVARVLGKVVDEFSRQVSEAAQWANPAVSHSSGVEEEDERVVVTLDLPGVSVEDLEVSVDGRTLHVHAKRSRPARADGKKETIRRRVSLPCEVLEAEVEAELARGVLTVILPKATRPAGVKVKVKAADDDAPPPKKN